MNSTLNAMKLAKRWLLHSNKHPYYATNLAPRGKTDTQEDRDQLVNYEEARAWLEKHRHAHKARNLALGFALGPDGEGACWQGVDLDKVSENDLNTLADSLPGYVEVSPSGNGFHAIGLGEMFDNIGPHGTGKEAYSHGRFFTFTGEMVRDEPVCDLREFVRANIAKKTGQLDGARLKVGVAQEHVPPEVYNQLEAALKVIPAEDYEVWHKVLQALKRLADTRRAFRLAASWSTSSPNSEHTYQVFHDKWERDLNDPGPLTYRSIFQLADQYDRSWRMAAKPPTDLIWTEVDLSDLELEPIDYLIDGFLARSLMVLVGMPGLGKSTAMVSLAAVIAGIRIPGSPLEAPVPGRKIIVVTEDVGQFKRNLVALSRNCGVDVEALKKAFVLFPARRVIAQELVGLKAKVEAYTVYTPEGVMLRPWLVFDTTSSSIQLDDENSNAEVSSAIAWLKAEFFEAMECSVCLVTHTTKQATPKDFTATARGAGAWAGDVTLTAGIFGDAGQRALKLGKRRYSPPHTSVALNLVSTTVQLKDRYGRQQDQVLDAVLLDWADGSEDVALRDQARSKGNALQAAVLRFIDDQGRAGRLYTRNDLERARDQIQFGLGKDRLADALNDLVDAGLLKKGSGVKGTKAGWEFSLTDAGRDALRQTPT